MLNIHTNNYFLHIYFKARDYNESNRTAHSILNETPEEAQHLLWHNIYFSILFVLMMWMAFLQRSFFETKLLRYVFVKRMFGILWTG